TELRQGFGQLGETGLDGAAIPEAAAELHVDAVGAGVLGNDQQFLHAGLYEALGFTHDVANGPAHEIGPHRVDDAEAAAVVAAFGDFQVVVVTWGQLHALRGNEVNVRVVLAPRRSGFVHSTHHLFVLLGPGHSQDRGVNLANQAFFHPHAARHD